jgi:hypothetical protein
VFDSRTGQVTFVVIDHEIVSTVIRTEPLLCYVQKFQFLAKVRTTSAGQLLDSLSRNDSVAELCSSKFNMVTAVIRIENYRHKHHHPEGPFNKTLLTCCCRLGLIEPVHGQYWKVHVTLRPPST